MKYAVLARQNERNGGRYVNFCDDRWYDASPYPIYKFTMDEAHRIAEQMRNHYCYVFEIIDQNNVVVKKINWLNVTTVPKLNIGDTFNETVAVQVNDAENTVADTTKPLKKPNIKFNKVSMLKNLKRFGYYK